MAEIDKSKVGSDVELLTSTTSSPSIFISHDARDAELAEAFSKLLKSVSAGMIKAFRSSDKKGADGIDFGEEWYKRLMTQLQSTSDVVCLFTERSLDRPWILFEAGVAKGKLNTPVIGVALGVSLTRVSAGPFYQFMNMDDSEVDLTKLVYQLAKRVPNLELDSDVVKSQVANFKATEATLLKKLTPGSAKVETREEMDESAVAKLAEEMKALPSRVAERLAELGDPSRRGRIRRISPFMIDELLGMTRALEDPAGILIAASLVRDDLPWLYELATDVYRAIKEGNIATAERQLRTLSRYSEAISFGPFAEELGVNRESQMFLMEFPRQVERILMRTVGTEDLKKVHSPAQRKPEKSQQQSKSV
jgi:hypothetical protein